MLCCVVLDWFCGRGSFMKTRREKHGPDHGQNRIIHDEPLALQRERVDAQIYRELRD
jgi:hypothetical protein